MAEVKCLVAVHVACDSTIAGCVVGDPLDIGSTRDQLDILRFKGRQGYEVKVVDGPARIRSCQCQKRMAAVPRG